MPTIYIDNQPYEVAEGQNLLQACLSLKLDLPFFCWHPAMGSVGACRQCAVKQFRDEKDTRGRIVMACMTPASNGTRISIDDPDARAFRASVIEWLMLNHPHDCPVCDEGSECHLQDMTYMTGHDYRRNRFPKRTYRNQYLGPFVNHEMNRCIQCYRCVRFYRDYAGGTDFMVFAIHDSVYFGRESDGILQSEFSGNLVEVCPTGVFTDKTLGRHYTRKWDLTTAPSICVHCGVGCNTIPGERYGDLRRIRNRFNGDVNGYFLCDRGRYGYEFVNSGARVRMPLMRPVERFGPAGPEPQPEADIAAPVVAGQRGGVELTMTVALERLAALLTGGGRVIGIGSPQASLEANFALRTLVGPNQFYQGMADADTRLAADMLDIWRRGPAGPPSLAAVRASDAVLVLGTDVLNMAPVLALALRQSIRRQPEQAAVKQRIALWDDAAVRELIQQQKGPLYLATVAPTGLEEIATGTYFGAPADIARLGYAVAGALQPGEPDRGPVQEAARSVAATIGSVVGANVAPLGDLPGDVRELANGIAAALRGARQPLVVTGTGYGQPEIIHAAANVAWELAAQGLPVSLACVVPDCNSMGLAMMGGGTLAEAVRRVRAGQVDTVIVLENDLYRRLDAEDADALLAGPSSVITLSQVHDNTSDRAVFLLPSASFAEGDGTFVNLEGRGQRFYQVFTPQAGEILEAWRWLRDLMIAAGRTDVAGWQNVDDVMAAMAQELPQFAEVLEIAPPAGFRIAGMRIARQPERYTGRTSMFANQTVHEPKPPPDPDTPLSFSMEGYHGDTPPALLPRLWAPGWNSSTQALHKFQEEVAGPLKGGNPGKRLIEPRSGAAPQAFDDVPEAFRRRDGEWLLVPLYHCFGSEALSALAPGIQQVMPEPYLALNPADAEALRLAEGAAVELALGGRTRRLAVRLLPGLPAGLAGLPSGLPGTEGIVLPAWTGLPRA